ncbi:SIMPL domain-containing protein [Microbacterium sp. BG28]|uniref:SIMPL domain-containing protein n=1 Tax=Microbacterium sp. BG28 TaxID=3097356 RepID=UPI002A5A58BE|nr:SIMPL domain-containing protein [Microbacterium sp. BG28]MDY0828912.1 SIMPL domain-containing protein [Microbacterium sp. BG28]
MSEDVTITVRGSHEERISAEEGVARITVRVEHPDRGEAMSQLAASGQRLRDQLDAQADSDGLVSWISSRAQVFTDRPWGPDGIRLDPVHHASLEFRAVFDDVDALSVWIDAATADAAVQLDGIDWRLREATALDARDRVARAAVQDAVARARSYAASLGLHHVTAVEIADAGLLSSSPAPAGPMTMRSVAADPAVAVRPDEVVVAVGVEARFSAR